MLTQLTHTELLGALVCANKGVSASRNIYACKKSEFKYHNLMQCNIKLYLYMRQDAKRPGQENVNKYQNY